MICIIPFIGAIGSWIAVGLINRPAGAGRRRLAALFGGLAMLAGIYAYAFRLISSSARSFFPIIPFGDAILLFSAISILLRTAIAIWGRRHHWRTLAGTGAVLALIVPLAMKAWVEYPVVRAEGCYITSALALTASDLEAWRSQHGQYPNDLHGSLEFDRLFYPAECDRYVAATNRFIHVLGYEQPYWLYRRTPAGYDLGYFWPGPDFADISLGNRVCIYSRRELRSTCGYNDWGPFAGYKIIWAAKE
jgi:hypothetical protein